MPDDKIANAKNNLNVCQNKLGCFYAQEKEEGKESKLFHVLDNNCLLHNEYLAMPQYAGCDA